MSHTHSHDEPRDTTKTRRKFGRIQKLPSGKYRARYTGPDGILHKAPQTYYTEDDAAGWLRAEEKLIEFGEWTAPSTRYRDAADRKITTGEWVTTWLDLCEKIPLKQSTMQSYRDVLDRRLFNVTGKAARLRDIPLNQVTRRDVSDWWDAITETYDSPPYNRNAYVRLKTAFRAAVDRDMITLNPVDVPAARSKPKPVRKEMPQESVMWALVNNVDPQYKLVTILTLFHGLRIGEALGLRRRDIVTKDGKMHVHVRGNVFRKAGVGMVRQATPKSSASHRAMPIFEMFYDDVRHHLKTYAASGADGAVFPAVEKPERVYVMDTTYREALARAKRRLGITDRITDHYGRVWLITTLAERGMTPPAIGQLLGQVDLKTITEIYMRATERRRDEILGQVSDLITSSTPTEPAPEPPETPQEAPAEPESPDPTPPSPEPDPPADNVISFDELRRRRKQA